MAEGKSQQQADSLTEDVPDAVADSLTEDVPDAVAD